MAGFTPCLALLRYNTTEFNARSSNGRTPDFGSGYRGSNPCRATNMIETHPFGDFIPDNVRYLMLGSFVTKPSNPYEWFYANGRNQFWPIMQEVYGMDISTKDHQQHLFSHLGMALSDIILSCERSKNSNLDTNLTNIVFNTKAISDIITKYAIRKIYFTSRFVEKLFRKHFRDLVLDSSLELVTLPSPSPRYAAMSKAEKISKYKELLPQVQKY